MEEINTSPLESGKNQEIFATTYCLFTLFHHQPTRELCMSGTHTLLKPCTSDWDLNPCSGTRSQPKPRLGLEPMRLGLEPSQNPDWDLNPCSQDSNLAKTHSLPTEITHLVSGLNEAQVLDVSSQKEFSERQSDR